MSKNIKKEEKEEKEREAISNRVADKKAEYDARKKAYAGKAIKLSAEILQGINYEEEAYVKLVNGTVGAITIRPLGEGEMMKVLSQVGLDALEKFGQTELTEKDYDFFWSIVSIATEYPKELIKKTFAMGESATLANRIMEISGFAEGVDKELEDF